MKIERKKIQGCRKLDVSSPNIFWEVEWIVK